MCGVLKSSAYFVSAHALHFLLAPCALLITHTPRGTVCIPCWDKRFSSILHALYSIYNSYATRAIVCAQPGNRSPSPLLHFPYFLRSTARTASQPAASDVIWLLSTTRGSVLFPPYPVLFSTFPLPCAHMLLVPTKQRLFDYFGKFISRHLSLKVTGKIPKYTGGDIENYRRPAPTTPPSTATTTATTFSTVGGRRRHRRSFMDVCIKWHIQLRGTNGNGSGNKTTIRNWFLVF